MKISDLGLRGPVIRRLRDSVFKIETVGDLVLRSEQELLSMNNFGRVSLSEVKNRLRELGLELRY